jgi:hypothetical protein
MLVALTPHEIPRLPILTQITCQEFDLNYLLDKKKEIRRRERRTGNPCGEV